ncbi:T9SS type A sorting domain-containing protein [Flavobacterium sp. HSC-61S13]|uniref:T9SS type A sorting domain-containing protein n=1 Tax=Flavobacterium sp. HSC-61S13 TaxID=2910963 RepID=UPI0020A19890|nr:T9SS type A sorting domain-containing protein [Flavobacterium sp. HSC-61S13]MCP1996698.1 hypothetical protein [Flavobacterium sp. HSC-61S13]
MKKLLLTISLAVVSAYSGQAQSYNFNHFDQSYTELTGATTLNTQSWFYHSFDIPLPFKINIFGDEIKNLSLSNGILYADSKTLNNIQYQLFAQTAELLDGGYQFNAGSSPSPSQSPLRYKVEGTTGNRILKIEVANAANGNEYFEKETTTMRVNFQYWFYEGIEQFEYRYGTNTITDFGFFFNDYALPNEITPNFAVIVAKILVEEDENGNEEEKPVEVYSLIGDSQNPVGKLSSVEPERLTTYPKTARVYQFKNSTLGIDKHAQTGISIYPNPTNDVLNISLDIDDNNIPYNIFDVLGKRVLSGTRQSTESPIMVNTLNKGVYFIKIGNYKTVKFIKN